MLPLLVIGLGAALIIGWLIGEPFYRLHRRRRILERPFPDAWRRILRERVPLFRHMPADLQLQLKRHMQVFLAEKTFVGCEGIVVTDDMRVTIAAQACLLILNRPTDYYPTLREILIYPSAFVVERTETDFAGVAHRQRRILSGESWSRGQVILSWRDTLDGAAVPDDGHNVVIHEFAHQLDMEKGFANGAPFLAQWDHYARWAKAFNREFDTLRSHLEQSHPTLLHPYAATNPAEFFAVASEAFFEKPRLLADDAPDLYRELQGYYRVDPLTW